MTQGTMPIIGYNYASRNIKRLKHSVRFALIFTTGVITVLCAAFIAFASPLVRSFMDNDTVVGYGSWFLRGFCIAMPLMCIDYSAVGIFQACGLGRRSLVFALLRKIVLEIPALFLLNYLFPLYGLPFASVFAEIVLMVVAIVMLLRLFKQLEAETN